MTCPACDPTVDPDASVRIIDLCAKHRDAAFLIADEANEAPANGVVQVKWSSGFEHGEA